MMTEIKRYAYEQAYLEDTISLIRHCEKKGDLATGYRKPLNNILSSNIKL